MRRIGKWLPFLVLSVVCFVTAYHPELPRKPFHLSLDVSPSTLAYVAYKPVHYQAAAVSLWLAILAVGSRHILNAVALTLWVCFGIELIEAGVPGHYGRLADMVSYSIGATIGVILFTVATAVIGRFRQK